MEGFTTFIGVIIIVFGILQIILFFKIWAMTNNVKDIQRRFVNQNLKSEANIAHMKGDIDAAEKCLNESLLKEISDLFYSTNDYSKWKDELDSIKWRYKEAFKKIDRQAPDFEKYKDSKSYL